MAIFLMTLLVFVVLCIFSYMIFHLLDKGIFRNRSEKEIARLQEVEESHVWWLSRVVYSGFAGMCLFLIATLVAVQFSLGEMANVFFHLMITVPLSAFFVGGGYLMMRYLFCKFWIP